MLFSDKLRNNDLFKNIVWTEVGNFWAFLGWNFNNTIRLMVTSIVCIRGAIVWVWWRLGILHKFERQIISSPFNWANSIYRIICIDQNLKWTCLAHSLFKLNIQVKIAPCFRVEFLFERNIFNLSWYSRYKYFALVNWWLKLRGKDT